MALYDGLIQILNDKNDPLSTRAAMILSHLQNVVRFYNSDDAIFDDEKTTVDLSKFIIPASNDEPWPENDHAFIDRTQMIPIRKIQDGVVETPDGVGRGMIFSYDKGTIL